jgi:ABC-type sulfate/molybdate transport systems ATPase subunit
MMTASFTTKLNDLSGLHQKLIGQRSALLRRQSQKSDELKAAQTASVELQKVKAVIDSLIQQYIGFQLEKISEYVTYGLKTVIHDQNLTFKCNITTKANKPFVDMITVDDKGNEANVLDAFGGSVAQVESLILRVLAVMQLKLYPFLALDESLNAVSAEYVPNTSKLLNEITKQLGIKILLVTHDPEMLQCADKVYNAKESANGLILEEIKRGSA